MRVTGKPRTLGHYFHELRYNDNYTILQPLKNTHAFVSCEKDGYTLPVLCPAPKVLERISSRQSAISLRLVTQRNKQSDHL